MRPADTGYICYLLADEMKHLSEKRPVEGRVYLGSQFEGPSAVAGKAWHEVISHLLSKHQRMNEVLGSLLDSF